MKLFLLRVATTYSSHATEGDNSGGDGDGSDSGDDFVPEIADVGSEKSFGSVTTPPPKETSKKKYVPVEYDV